MNERIKELVEQAGIHFHNGGTLDVGPNGIAKFVLFADMERFAELIVQECAWAADFADKEPGDYILKRFGIEE